MNWNLTLRTRDSVLCLTERRNGGCVAVHKYDVVEDRRGRVDPEWSVHNNRDDLSKLAVRHRRSVELHRGRVVDTSVEPIPRAARQLNERGVEVRL